MFITDGSVDVIAQMHCTICIVSGKCLIPYTLLKCISVQGDVLIRNGNVISLNISIA